VHQVLLQKSSHVEAFDTAEDTEPISIANAVVCNAWTEVALGEGPIVVELVEGWPDTNVFDLLVGDEVSGGWITGEFEDMSIVSLAIFLCDDFHSLMNYVW